MKNPTYHLRVMNPETKAALEGLYQEYKAPVSIESISLIPTLPFNEVWE